MQKDVQEWKNRITVTTAPTDTTVESSAEAKEADTGCCSLNGASSCCSSNGTSKGPSSCSLPQERTTAPRAEELPFSSLLCYGCLTNLRDLHLKSMGSSNSSNSSNVTTNEEGSVSSFDLPPYVAETLLQRLGLGSLEEYQEKQLQLTLKGDTAGAVALDPRESLREQIQEFLIESDDEDDTM